LKKKIRASIHPMRVNLEPLFGTSEYKIWRIHRMPWQSWWSPKTRKWHFRWLRDSRFKKFPDEHALDPLENSRIYGARLVPLALLLGGPSKILNRGPWHNVTPLASSHQVRYDTSPPAFQKQH
jgi:hypothetical protein